MRRLSQRARIISMAGAASVVAAVLVPGMAQADSASPSPTTSRSVFTIGVLQDMDSANPFTGITSAAYEVFQMEYPTLVEYGAKDFAAVPGIADSWTEAPDHSSWTFKIHPGLKWSDGQPMTAKDVAYTYNRILNGKYEQTNFGSYVSAITKAEAPDDLTVILHTNAASPIVPHPGVYIIPEHIWKSIDEKAVVSFKNEGTPDAPSVAGGPYYMIERKVGQFIRMQANPNFWRGTPAVDEIDFKLFKNGDAMAQALKKGEIDFAEGLETNVYNSLKNQPNITTVAAAPASFNELAFNTGAALDDGTPIGDGNPLLKDKKLRAALAHAIDKQAMVDKILGGDGVPGDTLMPPRYSQWHVAPTNPMAYDPAAAKQLLDAAGYTVGSDGIRADAQGNRLSFRLLGRTDSSTSQKAVQFIKGYLAAVGVETNVKFVSEDNLTEIIGQGKYDMFEWGWGVEPDPNYMLNVFTCANRSYKQDGAILANLSDSFYCNPAYDALNAKQQVETDLAKRQAITGQMQQMLYDDAPYIITYFDDGHEAYRSDRFTGLVHQPEPDGPLTFQWGTWTYEQMTPVTAADAGGTTNNSSGGSSVPWLPIIGGLIVAGGAGFLLARRRPANAASDDRE